MGREHMLDLNREGPSSRDIAESKIPPGEKSGVARFLEKTTQRIGPVATAALEMLGVTVVAGAASAACAPTKAPEVRPVETAVPTPIIETAKVIFPIASKGEGTPPPPTPTSKPAETPTSVPATPIESPKPTPTAKIELPADAPKPVQDAFIKLDELASKLTDPTVAKQYQKQLQEAATYKNPNRTPASVENVRGGMYAEVYRQLTGQYYATRDPEILKLAQALRSFIKEKYPATYGSVQQSNGWEITGE